MTWSFDDQLKGKIMEEIVSVMLQESDYMVLPYGYEQTHPALCQKWEDRPEVTKTLIRLRNSPDLLVYDKITRKTMLVEVKSHLTESTNYWMKKEDLLNYNEFWEDCILVQVIPKGKVFFAEWVNKIVSKLSEQPESEAVFITKNFRPFNRIFKINKQVLAKYQSKTKYIMKALRDTI